MPLSLSPEPSGRGLVETLLAEQRRHWHAGQPLAVEDYLRRHPTLRNEPDAVMELIYNEVILREQRGETPRPEDYLTRFPFLADELALQFQAHQMLSFPNADTRPGSGLKQTALTDLCPSCNLPVTCHADSCPACATSLPASDVPASAQPPSRLPQVMGYEVLEKIGEGGMGVVYKARHLALDRFVALKILPGSALAEPELRERFQREARAVARLHQESPHPNVVQVFEVGTSPGPFFSMELVEGGSLEQRLQRGTLAPGEAARLVELLARAMHHTHQGGIVHRDLKPANVLLAVTPGESGKTGGDLVPRITDFGLAKRLDVEQDRTREGLVMGTAPYMAPEQAQGRNQEVGPLADVYALGAILYECLTGRPPFKAATTLDTLLQVLQDDPVSPRQLQPKVPRDLEAVCLKCLEKSPVRRYRSAAALAEDLGRFLRGEPVEPRPVGPLGRTAKWVRRRPLVAALAGAAIFSLLAGTMISTLFAFHANQKASDERLAREDAQRKKQEAEIAGANEKLAREDAQRKKQDAETARQLETLARERAEHQLNLSRIVLARREWLANNVRQAEQVLDACPPKRRGWEWAYLKRLCHTDLPAPMNRKGFSGNRCVAFNRQGQFATANLFGKVVVWTELKLNKNTLWWPKEFAFLNRFPASGEVQIKALALSPDGRHVAAINQPLGLSFGGGRPQVKVWEIQGGKEVTPAGLANARANSLAFHPQGNRMAVASKNGVWIHDLARGGPVLSFRKHPGSVESVTFSPDGTRIASGSEDGSVRVWDAATGQEEYVFERQGGVMSVAFSPDGEFVAAGGRDGVVKIWEVWSNRRRYFTLRFQVSNLFAALPSGLLTGLPMLALETRTPRPDPYLAQHHDGMVRSLCFSPDRTCLVSASNDRTVKVFDLARGQTRTLRGHTDLVLSVAFRSDGKLLASAGRAEVKFWNPTQDQQSRTLGEIARETFAFSFSHDSKVAFSPDSKLVASTSDHRTVRVWEASTGKEVCVFRGHRTRPVAVAFGPRSAREGGQLIASGSGGFLAKTGEIIIWEAPTGKVIRKLTGHTARVRGLAFSPDGQFLVSGSETERERIPPDVGGKRPRDKPGTVIIWNAVTGQECITLRGYRDSVQSLVFSRDSKRLASACDGGVVKYHDVRTGQELFTLSHAGTCVALNPDGDWLAVGSGDSHDGGQITVYETATGQAAFTLAGHSDKVAGVAFSPDGKRLASAGHDGTVRLWDLETRQETLSLSQAAPFIESVVFSPDGQFLTAVGGRQTMPGRVWIWDATRVPDKK